MSDAPSSGPSIRDHHIGPEPTIESTTLADGVRIVTERMPEATSVSVGVYVGVGSRDEPEALSGASHFLQHLQFNGTEERSARSISMGVDAVGGEMNAFTSREHTAYYTRLPATQLAFGLDLLSDVIARPAFRPNEIDAEREVILEELLMAEDTPDDVLHMQLMEAVFPDHPLGRETLGMPDTIEALGRDEIAGFHAEHYRPTNLVVVAAGDLEHDRVVDGVADCLAEVEPGTRPERTAPTPDVEPLVVVHRPTEQVHVMFGWRALHYDDPDRYAFYVANHVLGGGMSSRLFQEIREERGLAYSVYSSMSSYSDCGLATVYAGTAPKHTDEVLTVLDDVIDGILADGITEEEHRVAVGYLEGSMLLGLEDSGSRMGRLGGSMIVRGEVTSIADHVARIKAVTRDDVQRVLERVFTSPRTVAAVGQFDPDDPRLAASVARGSAAR
jgi:predicted Zn-dependent peptidase